MNIANLLSRWALSAASSTAVCWEGGSLTYGEADRLSARLAGALRARGIRRGDRVALLLPNCAAFPLAYIAIQKIGAVAVSINVMSARREVAFMLSDSGARAVVVESSLLDRVDVGSEAAVIVSGGAVEGCTRLDDLLAVGPALETSCELPPEAPAAILYTSGTTGVPKGATLSHGNVVSNARAATLCYGAAEGDRFLLYLPLFHCFGQNAIMNAAFSAGAAVVLQQRFTCESVLEAVRRGDVTHFFGVPAVYARLLQTGVGPRDFERVRYVFSAAAPLAVELATLWTAATGHTIFEGYGLTETAPFATYNHRREHRAGSVGTPINDVEVRVVRDSGHEADRGEVGEIQVRGPNVMLGYWNRPEETSAVKRDGWLRTGDLGRLDDDGYLYVVDRIKEMIIVSGYKVYPTEVERILYEHPAVAEPAVFGVPDPVTGESVRAHVVLRSGARPCAADLRQFCRNNMANYKVPAVFTFTESLPKNATGKVLRRVLRDSAMASPESAQASHADAGPA
jgi:long-chain acyl-CoA synthetase